LSTFDGVGKVVADDHRTGPAAGGAETIVAATADELVRGFLGSVLVDVDALAALGEGENAAAAGTGPFQRLEDAESLVVAGLMMMVGLELDVRAPKRAS